MRLYSRDLVNLKGYCEEKGQLMFIYDYMSNGSLASHLHSEENQALRWDLRFHIVVDVARGLEYLHDRANPPVVHRDIKSFNILLHESMRAHITNFGFSTEEMMVDNNAKSDVYSFRVLLFEVITGRKPRHGLLDFVELAAMNITDEGQIDWEEIVDPWLVIFFQYTRA